MDGCPKLCAYKNVELSGGKIAKGIRVYDVMKRHRGANFGTATALSEEGWAVVEELAAEVAQVAKQPDHGLRESVMAEAVSKVGIISCSGEEIPEGTIARQAVRRVLEGLRPQQTVTLCLPLFLAGEEGERRFAREHPTITVDGCSKLCAKRGTEQYSGQVSASLVVSDILGDRAKGCHRSTRDADKADEAGRVARRRTDRGRSRCPGGLGSPGRTERGAGRRCGACCACGSPSPEGKLEVNGKAGRDQRPAVDLPASRKEGPATRQRFGRHVVGNRANLSRD